MNHRASLLRTLSIPFVIGLVLLFAGCTRLNSTDGHDPDEFGYRLEGTECIVQLHGGCVTRSYQLYDGEYPGFQFLYPQNWTLISISQPKIMLEPQGRTAESDPTQLFIWRESSVDVDVDALQGKRLDKGEGKIGVWKDVEWAIYSGEWNGQPVQSEWVTLTADPENPWVNFVFMLVTEPDHFEADQAALKAVVSSIVEQ